MQHARVAIYTMKPGTTDEAIHRAEEGALPMFRSHPGFVAYGIFKTDAETAVSLTLWDTAEEAEVAVKAAAEWVRETIADLIVSVENHVGDFQFFSLARTLHPAEGTGAVE